MTNMLARCAHMNECPDLFENPLYIPGFFSSGVTPPPPPIFYLIYLFCPKKIEVLFICKIMCFDACFEVVNAK